MKPRQLSRRCVIGACLMLLVSGGSNAWTVPRTETVIALFQSESTGQYPAGVPVAERNGSLYGVTQGGGSNPDGACDGGCGTVYQVTPPADGSRVWSRSVLYAFAGYPGDGAEPLAGLIAVRGALFGTAAQGGINTPNGQGGIVFELVPPVAPGGSWQEHVVHAFSGKDGLFPDSTLVGDASGALYGTTKAGGAHDDMQANSGGGTVFELTPPSAATPAWSQRVLYSFEQSNGYGPGTLIAAGRNLFFSNGPQVFELVRPALAAGSWTLRSVYNFAGPSVGAVTGLIAARGALYGTLSGGGAYGQGIAFEIEPSSATAWRMTILYQFRGGVSGGNPNSLTAGRDAALYGTTIFGGNPQCITSSGCGIAFRLDPPRKNATVWNEVVLHSFAGGSDGYYPSGVVAYGRDALVGSTCCGGQNSAGTVFTLTSARPRRFGAP